MDAEHMNNLLLFDVGKVNMAQGVCANRSVLCCGASWSFQAMLKPSESHLRIHAFDFCSASCD